MTGGSLPAQTWRDVMVVAHQGVEIREMPGVGMGAETAADAAGCRRAWPPAQPKIIDTKPGPPPVLTKRGADILVRVEKALDDAGKTTAKTSASEPPKPAKPLSSSSIAFPESFAAATPDNKAAPAAAQELTQPVRLIFITLLALIIASGIGLGSTYMTATKGTDLGTLKIGAWTARPKTGTADVDPYSRASIARSGELPVGTGDGVAFTANADDKDKPLDGRCDVVVSRRDAGRRASGR